MNSDRTLQFSLRYSPMLDGVRAFAVLSVMTMHAGVPYMQWGYLGVEVFFTLSGFLITTILVEEWSESGGINFKSFYMRRALRLLPALFFLLAASLLPVNPIPAADRVKAALAALFYVANWVRAFAPDFRMAALGHTWSLSIEEQFYLLWPVLLLTMLRIDAIRKRAAWIVGAAIAACMLYRADLCLAGRIPDRLYNGLDTRADALLAGCFLSLMLTFHARRPVFARPIWRYAALPIGVPAIAMVLASDWDDRFMFLAGYGIVAIASAVLILNVVESPPPFLKAVLSVRPVVWTGRISYGLYLWHYPFFNFVATFKLPLSIGAPIMFAGVFVIAACSYYFIERPFLRMKQRFERVSLPVSPPDVVGAPAAGIE